MLPLVQTTHEMRLRSVSQRASGAHERRSVLAVFPLVKRFVGGLKRGAGGLSVSHVSS